MATRTKIAEQDVSDDGSVLTLNVYGQPDDAGKQAVIASPAFDVTKLPPRFLHYCAARGLGIVASSRYVRTEDPDPAGVTQSIYDAMIAGTFSLERASTAEPSPFHEALAVLSGVPVHVVEHDIETNKDKWTKSYLRQVRNDARVAAKVAEIVKHRADRDQKAARERGKGVTPTFDLGSLFAGSGAEQQAAAE